MRSTPLGVDGSMAPLLVGAGGAGSAATLAAVRGGDEFRRAAMGRALGRSDASSAGGGGSDGDTVALLLMLPGRPPGHARARNFNSKSRLNRNSWCALELSPGHVFGSKSSPSPQVPRLIYGRIKIKQQLRSNRTDPAGTPKKRLANSPLVHQAGTSGNEDAAAPCISGNANWPPAGFPENPEQNHASMPRFPVSKMPAFCNANGPVRASRG